MNDSVMTPGRSIASSAWLRATPTSSSTTAINGRPRGTANATEFLSHAASASALTLGAGARVATCASDSDSAAGFGAVTGVAEAAILASSPRVRVCAGTGDGAGSTTCGAAAGFGAAAACCAGFCCFSTGVALRVVTLAPPALCGHSSKPPR